MRRPKVFEFLPYPLRQGKRIARKEKSRGSSDSLNLDEVHFTSLSRFFSVPAGHAGTIALHAPVSSHIPVRFVLWGEWNSPDCIAFIITITLFAHNFQQSREPRTAPFFSVRLSHPATAQEFQLHQDNRFPENLRGD